MSAMIDERVNRYAGLFISASIDEHVNKQYFTFVKITNHKQCANIQGV